MGNNLQSTCQYPQQPQKTTQITQIIGSEHRNSDLSRLFFGLREIGDVQKQGGDGLGWQLKMAVE